MDQCQAREFGREMDLPGLDHRDLNFRESGVPDIEHPAKFKKQLPEKTPLSISSENITVWTERSALGC